MFLTTKEMEILELESTGKKKVKKTVNCFGHNGVNAYKVIVNNICWSRKTTC